MFTLQPEEIQYVISSVDPKTIAKDEDEEDEGIGENRVEITLENGTRFVYQNLPFTLHKNNRQITALDISVKDMIDNMKSDKGKGKFHDVVLHYYAINKLDIPEIGTRIDVEIENPIAVNFGSIAEHSTVFKKYSVRGNFAVKEVQYESTIINNEIEQIFDAKITLTKIIGLDEEGNPEEEQEELEDMLLTLMNPIDATIPVQVYLKSMGWFNMIFDGLLVDISASSAKAMGREVLLAEKMVKDTFYFGKPYLVLGGGNFSGMSWSGMYNIEDVIEVLTRRHIRVPQVKDYYMDYGSEWCVGRFHHGNNFDSFTFVGMSVWDVLVKVANTYDYFLTVEPQFSSSSNIIHLHTENISRNGVMPFQGEISETIIEDRKVNFRANKSYTGIEVTGSLSPLRSNWGTPDYILKCYNKAMVAGEGIRFKDNQTIDTKDPTSDRTSFHCTPTYAGDTPPEGTSITASDGSISYIQTTIEAPEGFEADDYRSTITISVRPEILPCRRIESEGEEELEMQWEWYQGTITVKNIVPEGTNVAFVIKPQHGKLMNPGQIYVDIFGDYEDLQYFEIWFPVKTPKYLSLLQGYFHWGIQPDGTIGNFTPDEDDNLLSHNAELMQGQSDFEIEQLADYTWKKANQKLQNITLSLTGFFATKPSDIWQYRYKKDPYEGAEHIVVENAKFTFDKKRELKTTLEGYSYVWPI